MTIIKTLTGNSFKPSSSFTGGEAPTIFRGENLTLRGLSNGNPYFEVFGGNRNLGENYNLADGNHQLAGTVTFAAGQKTVSGTGTAFVSHLHIGQMILAGGEVFVVAEVVSNTSFIAARPATSAGNTQTAYRLPQFFELDGKRGVMLTGNAVQFEKGHIVAVGSGTLYINGLPLAGNSLVATNKPKIAIYRSTTNDYVIRDLGFQTRPPKPAIKAVDGGTKKMADGKHSFMISYWSPLPEGTDGYSNPCDVIKTDALLAPLEIKAADNLTRFEFDFTASLVNMPANAAGFIVYASLSGKRTVEDDGTTIKTVSPNQTNFDNGPWFAVSRVKTSALTANKISIEFLDSQVSAEVTGNNDAPPECEFVAKMEGRPLYISAYGKRRSNGEIQGSNPGPSVLLSKFGNPDGVPTEWAASLTSNIIGWFEGVGRWFLMTTSTLDFTVSTGLLGSGQELPIITRPYWRTGASNRYSVTMIDDTLFGFSGNKFFQSVGNGDENVKKYEFGAAVEDIKRTWTAGHVYTVQDSKNNDVCFFHSAAYKNAAGFWVSRILPYSLTGEAFLPEIVLSDSTRDMIVSGVAVVAERLYFLAGGRKANGMLEVSTFLYDEPDAANPITTVPYYLIWQPSDDNLENLSKSVHSIRPKGKFTNMKIQIHGARPGGELIIADFEKGTNALSGDLLFEDSDEITRYLAKKLKVKNLADYAIRLEGNWNGAGMKDRLDELAIEIGTHGRQR